MLEEAAPAAAEAEYTLATTGAPPGLPVWAIFPTDSAVATGADWACLRINWEGDDAMELLPVVGLFTLPAPLAAAAAALADLKEPKYN